MQYKIQFGRKGTRNIRFAAFVSHLYPLFGTGQFPANEQNALAHLHTHIRTGFKSKSNYNGGTFKKNCK